MKRCPLLPCWFRDLKISWSCTTSLSRYIFVKDDGVEFFTTDKKFAADKIRNLPLGRALDLERKKLLLGDEGIKDNQKTIRNKLIGFSSRTKADLMSTGADTS